MCNRRYFSCFEWICLPKIFVGDEIIKLPLKNIPQLKRPTQGVILMRFSKKGDGVVAAATIKRDEDENPQEKLLQ